MSKFLKYRHFKVKNNLRQREKKEQLAENIISCSHSKLKGYKIGSIKEDLKF